MGHGHGHGMARHAHASYAYLQNAAMSSHTSSAPVRPRGLSGDKAALTRVTAHGKLPGAGDMQTVLSRLIVK